MSEDSKTKLLYLLTLNTHCCTMSEYKSMLMYISTRSTNTSAKPRMVNELRRKRLIEHSDKCFPLNG